MVTLTVYRYTDDGAYVEGVCSSNDVKPVVGIANGSVMYEVDTLAGKLVKHVFDQAKGEWAAVDDAPGGCVCGPAPLVVRIRKDGWYDATDKTLDEIVKAIEAGSTVTLHIAADSYTAEVTHHEVPAKCAFIDSAFLLEYTPSEGTVMYGTLTPSVGQPLYANTETDGYLKAYYD